MLTSFDEAVHIFALSNADTKLWTAITLLGDSLTLGILSLILIFVFKSKERILISIAYLCSMVLMLSMKYIIGRSRPDEATLLTPSFPSGHTLGATAVYGIVAYMLWKRNYKWQAVTLLSLPVAVGLSRIMLLEHWATDVLAGWALGAVVVIALAMGTWRLQRSRA